MIEFVQLSDVDAANAYLDLANELCQIGHLLRRDDNGPAAPYHIYLVGDQFVVLKRFRSMQRSIDQVELAGTICITLGQDDAFGLALGRGRAATLTTRWVVLPVRFSDAQWRWQTSALPSSAVSSKEIAAEIRRRLVDRW